MRALAIAAFVSMLLVDCAVAVKNTAPTTRRAPPLPIVIAPCTPGDPHIRVGSCSDLRTSTGALCAICDARECWDAQTATYCVGALACDDSACGDYIRK